MAAVSDFVGSIIHWLYNLTVSIGFPNYGLAIFFLTLFIKLLLFPLTRSSVKSMKVMQDMQPKMQQIQKKYKDNPQKQQEELMKLYKENGANPLSGCLPLLIQMPIILALFTGIRNYFDPNNPGVSLEHAGFFWIAPPQYNLGMPDPYFILPVLAAIATFVQQKVSMASGPAAADQTQKTMLYIMPIFMGWVSSQFPAGLALYWVFYSVLSALEQWLIRREKPVLKEGSGAK